MPTTKVLVVDDRPENLIAMSAALEGSDYTIIEAQSGYDALREAELHDFAVILMDVQMPQMDGFEAARILRSRVKTKATPIIFVTAIHRTEQHEHQGYIEGAVDYLFKPINVDILKAKVSVFVELKRKTELLREAAVREREVEILKEAVAARDEFLSIASHELKSPLTPLSLHLQTFVELYETGSEGKLSREKIMQMFKTSLHQVERLTHLVNELIDVGRLRHGNLELNLTPVNLSEVVRAVVNTLQKDLDNSSCETSVDVDPRIFGVWDRFRIEQVLVNLLENACKYGKGKPVNIKAYLDGEQVVLEIKDFGVGIAEHDQEKIFDRFVRASSVKNFGGIGLGLYISKQLVELHKGTISVESVLGQGSKFTIRLPIEPNLKSN